MYKVDNYAVTTVLVDGEGAVAALKSSLQEIEIMVNPASAGQHVTVIQNKLRQIKERVRAHLAGLPFDLPRMLLRWLVFFSVSRLKMMPSHTRIDATSPSELYRGRKVDYKRDVRACFG
jgi:hypothetical protein